ncbi:MAG: hypothetical protein DCC67_18090 [Planctomycetota bacterium]|nr:MAG: hypothetical protein DCC67_18090 [Planctomycetota bacterium]
MACFVAAACWSASGHGEPASDADAQFRVSVLELETQSQSASADAAACEEGQCPAEACSEECAKDAAGEACSEECEKEAAAEAAVAVQSEAKSSEQAASAGEAAAAAEADPDIVRPTHKQTLVISVNTGDLPQTTLNSFCLTADGRILAACGEGPGEVRVFRGDGSYVESWEVPVRPDAINVGSDGHVYIAGGGQLLRLDGSGKVLHRSESPHAAQLLNSKDQLRQEIIEQHKQMAGQFTQQIERYEKLIADLEEKIAATKEKGEEPSKADARRLESFGQMKKQFEEMAEQYGGKELTEEEIDQQVKSSLDYKLRVASISEAGGDVYLATCAAAGYGFCVWKLDHDFQQGKVIVSDLRGCCGQMDVQCCDAGIFVAENARHRVACYDKDGKLTQAWGQQARTGLDGFGSCCNPMNVALGADGSIYTAESELGRVKRFNPEGELVDLVGKVDIVPGCKKVAIAVDKTGDNVFMLDISRHHIVKMERLAAGEQIAYFERRSGAADDEAGGGSLGGALLRIFLGD